MFIESTSDFRALVERFRSDGAVAVDTEFLWQDTYYPILGLVQFGTIDGEAFLYDPFIKGVSREPLAELMADSGIVKILCDAQQDLTLISRHCGAYPKNIFDVRLAAGFAGMASTLSLHQIILDILEVDLPKTETRTDWTRRPLSDAQIAYAGDDVVYLERIRKALTAKAAELGTLDWLKEDLLALDNESLYHWAAPEAAWKKVKGARRLDGRKLAVISAIATIRERAAIEADIPRTWLVHDDKLMSIAENPPASAHELESKNGLTPRQAHRIGAQIMGALRATAKIPESELPHLPRFRVDETIKTSADKAISFLKKRGEDLHIDPALFGNRAQITEFVGNAPGSDKLPLAHGWRFETAGRELLH